jgi:hypothetical protein
MRFYPRRRSGDKDHHTTLPRWAQASLGALLIAIAIAAGTATLTVNVAFGAQESQFKAFIFGLADAMKIALPLTAALSGWTWFLRLAWGTALAFSIYAALSFYMTTSGQALLNAGQTDEVRAALAASLAAAEAGLTRIQETGSTEAIRALVTSAQAQMTAEKETGIGKNYRDATLRLESYAARLAEAEHRDALEAKRARAEAELAALKPKALGMADNLGALLNVNRAMIARLDSIIAAVIAITLAEMATYLTVYGVPLVISDRPRKRPEPVMLEAPETNDASASLFRLRMLIHSAGGRLTIGRRELADKLGARRSTLQDWITKWRDAKLIRVEIGPDGRTVLSLHEADDVRRITSA